MAHSSPGEKTLKLLHQPLRQQGTAEFPERKRMGKEGQQDSSPGRALVAVGEEKEKAPVSLAC